jgi:heterodisulfide reductase subunit A
MVSVGRHPNITLLTNSEVEAVSGFVGNFDVIVRKKARYVNEDLCTGCGTCVEKCPFRKISSEFDLGMGMRPAIYFHNPQAVPRVPIIDTENCAYFLRGKCRACEKFCSKNAIDFDQKDEIVNLEVGAIILATGFKDIDPSVLPQYGYRSLDNVLTGLEFERMLNSGGPTSGVVRLKNGNKPKRIAIVHCVGSRGDLHEYCSRVCCMYSLKLAHLAHELGEVDVIEYYRDMRTFGKQYESFYERVKRDHVNFIRYDRINGTGSPLIKITRHDEALKISTTDLFTGLPKEEIVDMVVLSTGMEAHENQKQMAKVFGISTSTDGFFLERHPKLAPVETSTDGIFIAGACQGPKDIPDSVAQGGAAAAAALTLIDAGHVTLEPFTAHIDPDICSGCMTCINLCPYNAISTIEYKGNIISEVNEVLCKGCGTCVAACPSGAAEQRGFTREQLFAEIIGVLSTSYSSQGLPSH